MLNVVSSIILCYYDEVPGQSFLDMHVMGLVIALGTRNAGEVRNRRRCRSAFQGKVEDLTRAEAQRPPTTARKNLRKPK